jgi:hypothetical protein
MSVRRVVFTLVVVTMAAAPLAAETTPAAPSVVTTEEKKLSLPKPVAQMRAVYLARLATLQAAFAETADPLRAASLQNEIRIAKLGFEADLLTYQLERARRYGHVEAQKELLASIEAIRTLMRGGAPAAPQTIPPDPEVAR